MDTIEITTGDILYKTLLWVSQEDRELMITEIRRELGDAAASEIENMYRIHAINKSE